MREFLVSNNNGINRRRLLICWLTDAKVDFIVVRNTLNVMGLLEERCGGRN